MSVQERQNRKETFSHSGAFWELVKIEAKLASRDPIGLLFGLVGPVLMVTIFGSIPYFRTLPPGTSPSIFESYIPILITIAVIFIALLSLPLPLARDRELGWLRGFSTTPVPPSRLLAAQVILNLLAVSASIAIVLGTSWAIFGATRILILTITILAGYLGIPS